MTLAPSGDPQKPDVTSQGVQTQTGPADWKGPGFRVPCPGLWSWGAPSCTDAFTGEDVVMGRSVSSPSPHIGS